MPVCFQSAPPPPPPPQDLQALLDATPPGQTLEIGSKQFLNAQPVIVSGGKSIHGNADAVVGIVPSTLRVWQTLIVRGAGSTLDGFQVVGNYPTGASSNVFIEGQHGVEIQGADDILLTNLFIHNVWGDAVAFQKDGGGNGSNRARIINCYVDDIGRDVFTPIAVIDLTVRQFNTGTPSNPAKVCAVNRSIVDIEPPGLGGWGTSNVLWHNCHYNLKAEKNTLSRLGQGRNGDIDNIVLDSVRQLGSSPFVMSVSPPDAATSGTGAAVRDGTYVFQSCGSTNNPYSGAHAPVRMWRTDGVEFHTFDQTSTSVEGVYEMNDCTGPGGGAPLLDSVVVNQRADKTGEWYAYDDGTYWKWSD